MGNVIKWFRKDPEEGGNAPTSVGLKGGRYEMKSWRCGTTGRAVIFNHSKFDNGDPPNREGTNIDRNELSDILIDLGFKLDVHENLTYEEIRAELRVLAKKSYHDYGCLIITVLTHGEVDDKLHARDKMYDLRDLWSPFTDKCCSTFAGKPKIFFIQACRGDQYDKGTATSAANHMDNGIQPQHALSASSSLIDFPHSDFLFVFSTMPDCCSWRNTNNGSPFIQTLCRTLKEYATSKHIEEMVDMVCQDVAKNFKANTDLAITHGQKQTPNTYSTLKRHLFLGEKKCVIL